MAQSIRIAALALLALLAFPSSASPITYAFTGSIVDISSGILARPLGEPVSGTFTFNPDTWLDASPTTEKNYFAQGVDAGIAFLIGGVIYDSIALKNGSHRIIIQGEEWEYASHAGPLQPGYPAVYTFIFETYGSGATSIHDPLKLGHTSLGALIAYNNNIDFQEIGRASFSVASLSQVPEPPALALALTGLAILVISARQRSMLHA